jgi:hypothetical protein
MTRKVMVTIEEELKMPPLLGQDFLEGYTYEIDHAGGFVTMKKTITGGLQSNNLYDLPCTHTGERDIVTIQVNGRDFPIMVDTGASRSIFDPTALAKIGVQVSEDLPTIPMSGVGGNISMRETTLQIRMGPINRSIPALIGRAGGGSAVGQDVLSGNRFTIDSNKHLLRFFH